MWQSSPLRRTGRRASWSWATRARRSAAFIRFRHLVDHRNRHLTLLELTPGGRRSRPGSGPRDEAANAWWWTHGLPPVEVGGEGRVLDPRPSEPSVELAERPGVRPAGVRGRARPRRGRRARAAHRRAVRDGGAGRRADGGDGSGPLEGELVRPAPTTSSSPRTRISRGRRAVCPRPAQQSPPDRLPGSSEAAAPLAFRCRSAVRNSFHGGGPRFPPRFTDLERQDGQKLGPGRA